MLAHGWHMVFSNVAYIIGQELTEKQDQGSHSVLLILRDIKDSTYFRKK